MYYTTQYCDERAVVCTGIMITNSNQTQILCTHARECVWFAQYLRAVAKLHEGDRSVGSTSDEDAGGSVEVHARHGGRVLNGAQTCTIGERGR